MSPPPESSRDLEKTNSQWEIVKIQGWLVFFFLWQVLKEPAQAEIWERQIWSDSNTAFPANPKCSPCSCSPSWQLEGHRWWVWRDPEGDDTELPYNEGGEKEEKYLLKLCFSPDAEWTMTFRKPYKPDDSSSGESNAHNVKQTVLNYIFIVKRGHYFAKCTFLIHGHWNGVNGLKFHTWISEHLQLQRCQRETFKACKKSPI